MLTATSSTRSFRLAKVYGLLLAMLLLTIAPDVVALPRHSARYGQNCALCHQNPTGGGLRSLYASQYLVPTELSWQGFDGEALERINPQIGDNLVVGADLRVLLYQGEQDRSGVFAMQSDVYLAFQVDQRFVAYVEQGKGGTQEFYGMAYVLPAQGYLKAGQFIPAYGWRFADHQLAGRRYLLFAAGADDPKVLLDSGVELGLSPGGLDVALALLEGGGENGESHAGRVVLRRSLGPVNLALGGSTLRRQEGVGHRRASGIFGYVSAGPVSWLWEVDETRQASQLGRLVTQELAWQLVQGCDLRATYSYQDPDRDLKSGARTRWGLGFDTLPSPFFGVQLMGHYHTFDSGPQITEDDYYQAELVLHFLY